jgi:peptidase C13-like protein
LSGPIVQPSTRERGTSFLYNDGRILKVISNNPSIQRLAAAARLWTLRRAAIGPGIATDLSVVGFGLASLALWIGLDRLRVGPGAQFDPLAIPIISLYALLVLGAAFLLSRVARPRVGYQRVLFTLVALLPVVIASGFLIAMRLEGRAARAGWVLLSVYVVAYLSNALRTLSGAWQVRATLIVLLLSGAVYPLSRVTDLSPWVWSLAAAGDEGEEADAQMPPSVAESLLFDQRRQIDAAVDGMTANERNAPAVFFVGFAGVADQRVFAEEIKLAARVVDGKFSLSNRRLLLINDRRDLDDFPLASASGLGYALRAVAQKMDLERDILFLALSSHGSADAVLSVANGTLPLEQLTDEDLETALKESGIKRRIIVISACYAGAFIKPLQNPDTIVIAAAATDRTSFGCSDDRDMTYFGEAFYRDALPGAKTLQEAFESAKASIALREGKEHETPSEPQAFFGSAISAVLEKYPMHARQAE